MAILSHTLWETARLKVELSIAVEYLPEVETVLYHRATIQLVLKAANILAFIQYIAYYCLRTLKTVITLYYSNNNWLMSVPT